MQKLIDILKKPAVQYSLLIGFLALVSGAGWMVYQTQVPPGQPIEFPHNVHVGLQIQCLYCHPGAFRQASAGLPTQNKCWGCHQQLKKYEDPSVQWPAELEKLRGYVERNEPIPWVPVYIVPDFVHFNHRPHVAAGLNCEVCHGDMSKQVVAELQQTVNMGWCITCHQQKTQDDPEKRAKLLSCETCHY